MRSGCLKHKKMMLPDRDRVGAAGTLTLHLNPVP